MSSLFSVLLDEDPIFARRELASIPLLEALQPLTNSLLHQLSEVNEDASKDNFQASIDVQQFKPEEITVKLTGENTVTVEAKHEEKQDEHGYIYRHFVRRYEIPDNFDMKKLKSKLSSDGVLKIIAPPKRETKQLQSKEIPIIKTGPIRSWDQKSKKAEA